MNTEQIADVWAMLDRSLLAKITSDGPSPVFATISGAHLYGFASPDSDVDLRGAFMHSTTSILGLRPPNDTISIDDKTTIDLDWVAHDIRKFARLMLNHNGYVLEQLFSPLVVLATPAYKQLLDLATGCITRPTARHYQGFARGRRTRLLQPKPTIKHLLYAYRVLLTGIHLMQTGEIVANITTLNRNFCLDAIDELVVQKQTGTEQMALTASELASHTPLLDKLETQLEQAHATSSLPEEATARAALEDFVINLRLDPRERLTPLP